MKGHKHHTVHHIAKAGVHGAHHVRAHHARGGEVESARKGDDDAAKDLKDKPNRRNNAPKIMNEAEAMSQRKAGGRAERKRGGHVMKHVGEIHGEQGKAHAGRKARKSGGRAGGSEANPFTSARHGTPATGRKLEPETMG